MAIPGSWVIDAVAGAVTGLMVATRTDTTAGDRMAADGLTEEAMVADMVLPGATGTEDGTTLHYLVSTFKTHIDE